MNAQISTWINERVAKVMSAEQAKSFVALDLKAQLTGIAVLAHIANDAQMRDAALAMIEMVK